MFFAWTWNPWVRLVLVNHSNDRNYFWSNISRYWFSVSICASRWMVPISTGYVAILNGRTTDRIDVPLRWGNEPRRKSLRTPVGPYVVPTGSIVRWFMGPCNGEAANIHSTLSISSVITGTVVGGGARNNNSLFPFPIYIYIYQGVNITNRMHMK